MQDFHNAMEVFSVLGKDPGYFANTCFRFNLVRGWENSSFSPIILSPGRGLNPSDLDRVEAFFHENPIKNTAIKNVPYFNFFKGEGLYDLEAIEDLCKKHHWQIDPDPLTINLIRQPLPLKIASGYHLEIFNAMDLKTNEDYMDVLRSSFHADEAYLNLVEQVYHEAGVPSFTIMIRDRKNRTIGGGSVSVRGQYGFLTWGAINPSYRKKGFHDWLLAGCKMVATSYGAEHCALTTRNNLIRRKTGSFVDLFICRKKTLGNDFG